MTLVFSLAVSCLCASATPFVQFEEVAEQFSVAQRPGTLGRGASWVDFDDDGWPDLFVANDGPDGETAFYHNDEGSGFTEITGAVGLDFEGQSGIWGGVWADYDNDGDPDLFVARGGFEGALPNILYRNDFRESGRFQDVTSSAGLGSSPAWSWSASWRDYNLDGRVDLLVANGFSGLHLFHNQGDGTFVDRSEEFQLNANLLWAYKTPIWLDYDRDRYPDIYCAVGARPDLPGDQSRLFHNEAGNGFQERGLDAAVDAPSFTAATVDFNQDGWPDIWAGPYEGRKFIFTNTGNGSFTNESDSWGFTYDSVVMGFMAGDLNRDGYPDFLMGVGNPNWAGTNVLGVVTPGSDGGFVVNDLSEASGLSALPPARSHGMCFSDFDRDGDMDVYISNGGPTSDPERYREPNYLLRNVSPNTHHWVRFKLIGTRSDRSAIGAEIEVYTPGRVVYSSISGGQGFCSQNEPIPLIGLGDEERILGVTIRWPVGTIQNLGLTDIDREHTVVEPSPSPSLSIR